MGKNTVEDILKSWKFLNKSVKILEYLAFKWYKQIIMQNIFKGIDLGLSKNVKAKWVGK